MNCLLATASNPFNSSEHFLEISRCCDSLELADRRAERRRRFDEEQPVCWQHCEKVRVCGYNDSTECCSTLGVYGVVHAKQSELKCIHDIDTPCPQCGYYPNIDTLVSVEPKRHNSALSRLLHLLTREVTLQLCDHGFGSGPILLNRFLMIVVISKRGMNVSQRQMGMRAHDFFRRHSRVKNLSRDLTHLDVRPDHHRPRQRSVDVHLGAGDIASQHDGFLAPSPRSDHTLGAKSASFEVNQPGNTVSYWGLAVPLASLNCGRRWEIEAADTTALILFCAPRKRWGANAQRTIATWPPQPKTTAPGRRATSGNSRNDGLSRVRAQNETCFDDSIGGPMVSGAGRYFEVGDCGGRE